MHTLGSVPVGGKNPIRIMGILNTSPESFYKKSIHTSKKSLTNTVIEMENQGADFIDIGGMSTAPYLKTLVSEKEEIQRITKAIKIIQNISNLPISIDTCRSNVAKNALEFGVEIINDISGLKYDKKMIDVLEKFQPSLILCAYSKNTISGNLISKTKDLLKQSIKLAEYCNVPKNKIVLDPAIGFFRKSGTGQFFTKIKTDWVQRDLSIIQNLKKIKMRQPILVSVSNKSFIGKILKKDNPQDRLYGSLAAEVISIINGADIIRTHNVEQTRQAAIIAQNLAQKKSRKAYNTS